MDLGPDLVGDGAPLGAGGFDGVLGEGGGDEGGDHPATALSGMGQGIALEVNPAPLPGGAENLGRQAKVLGISRGSVYYLPRPTSDGDLALMRGTCELHLE